MLLHEDGGVPERFQLIGTLGEAVAFVGIDIVADGDPPLTQQLDDLVALSLDVPRIVGVSPQVDVPDAAEMAAQNHLATLSTDSVHRVIAGATHEALIAEQRDAAATTRAVLDVASSVRSGEPLAR